MRTPFVVSVVTGLVLAGCALQDHSQILTDKCVEDGLKLEGCECIVDLMEVHLTEDDIKGLSKAARSGDESDSNFGKIEDQIRDKLKKQMEDLPPIERIKKGTDVGIGLAECGPKLI